MNALTMIDVLEQRSVKDAENTALMFLDDRGHETCGITFSELFRRASAAAARLAWYEEQERVVIVLPTAVQFPIALLGCMLAGKIAVPLPVPNNHRAGDIAALLDDCDPSCIITTGALRNGLRARLTGTRWERLDILTPDELETNKAFPHRRRSEDSIAILQYTSGSTSLPKGVIIRHRNLMANHRMLKDAFGLDRSSTVVGWTPLYHDQGLIGNLLHPLYTGAKCVLMPAIAFLRSPMLWLRTISHYQAHTSGGPNFAFNLCVDKFDAGQCDGIDLSSWKIAFNGAEPVSPATMRRFSEQFAPYGFDSRSMLPCYGMAEATLFVSGGPVGRGAVVTRHDSGKGEDAREMACSGLVHRDVSIRILPTESITSGPSGQSIGEICIAGPNITSGYWRRSAEEAFVDPETGVRYLRTGDMGFIGEDGLYVTGRKKELMIVRGRNIYPYDIEQTIAECHVTFQKGGCAVFTLAREAEAEEVVAVQEVARAARHGLPYEELAGVVRKNVVRRHDVRLNRLYFVTPGFIPRTSSGKIKRVALANSLLVNTVEQTGILAQC
jgi:acyl-CoA synthetase (AMP-forming)/AMP-acid ligase II